MVLQELGAKRLKAALSCSDDAVFIRDSLLPFLKLLGCDALGRGTCKQPLIEVVQTIYQVRRWWCRGFSTNGELAPLPVLATVRKTLALDGNLYLCCISQSCCPP